MEKVLIDKTLLQAHRQCPRRAWLEFHGTVLPEVSSAAQSMIEQGMVVHEAARRKFPGAKRLGAATLRDAAKATADELRSGAKSLLEAAFVADNLGVRVDALEMKGGHWTLTEVKSASEVKDEHLDDCAIQLEALRRSGISVSQVDVCHLDTGRVLEREGGEDELLVTEDVTEVVKVRADSVAVWLSDCMQALEGGEPAVQPGKQCSDPHDCPFKHHCGDAKAEERADDPQHLPSHAGPIKGLIAAGCVSILALPENAFSHERNLLVREAVLKGEAVVRKEFAQALLRAPFPRAFVDFEAAGLAIPRFVGMRPYQALPFQWSVHRVESLGLEQSHAEFIDVSGGDPRRQFAESLLASTNGAATVFVYSGYEKGRLNELAAAFPDLADGLQDLIARLVDLLPAARRGYYHPKMYGSWSIKKILPTLPPKEGVTYEGLEGIADGLAAQAAYIELTNHAVIGEQRQRKIAELLAYCKVDTAGLAYFVECVQAHA